MYISQVRLRDIRCFRKVELQFELSGPKLPWTLILGDNASGKTAFLKAIAIGLCDEPSAAALIKESEEGYIRRGAESGKIEIFLKPSPKSRKEYRIETKLRKIKTRGGGYEEVKKSARIAPNIPWRRIFVCGYGAGRGTSGTGDITGYSAINAVYSLFNYNEGLRNPELTLYRIQNSTTRRKFIEFIREFLFGSQKGTGINLTDSGITFDGPWGLGMPFRDVADGYRSSFLWIADFVGWAVSHKTKLTDPSGIEGIVLIDEIEQHLHPSWQAQIVRNLREAFPSVQFIASTHSPVVASSVGQPEADLDPDKLIHFERKNGAVRATEQDPMGDWRIDQILSSHAFKYVTLVNPDWNDMLRKASILAGKGNERSPREEKKYDSLKNKIARMLDYDGSTEIERKIQSEIFEKTRSEVLRLESKLSERKND